MKRTMIILMVLIAGVMLVAQMESNVVIYEEGFEGAITASGEIFSQENLTAAHETLPLGTQVEIMNILNGKKVTVTINDRIKDAPDLFWISQAAADKIDLLADGPTEILYTIIGDLPDMQPSEVYKTLFQSLGENLDVPEGDPRIPRSTGDAATAYGVQVYACEKRMDAVTLSRRIQQELEYISYFEKYTTENGQLFRVIIGDFLTEEEALDCYWKLQNDLPQIFLIEIY